jgi:hypothetical protein
MWCTPTRHEQRRTTSNTYCEYLADLQDIFEQSGTAAKAPSIIAAHGQEVAHGSVLDLLERLPACRETGGRRRHRLGERPLRGGPFGDRSRGLDRGLRRRPALALAP